MLYKNVGFLRFSVIFLAKAFFEGLAALNYVRKGESKFAKAILHFAYDIQTGHLHTKRIQECIAFSRFVFGEETLPEKHLVFHAFWSKIEQYELPLESIVNQNGTISLWTVIQAFFSEWPLDYFVKCSNDTHPNISEVHGEDHEASELRHTYAYHMDGLKHCLRLLMTLTVSIQRLHLDVLEEAKTMPNVEHLQLRRKTLHEKSAKKPTTLWGNYLFDLAAMWINIARFRESFIDHDKQGIRKNFHEARFWSRSSGLTQSSVNLWSVEKHPSLLVIAKRATCMHWIFLRIFAYLPHVMDAQNISDLSMQWQLQNIGDIVFVYIGGSKRIMPDTPNVGTTVYECFRFYGETILEPYHFGFGLPNMKDQLLGLEPEDLVFLAFASHVSTRLCQSYDIIWNSLVNPKHWTKEMRDSLPSMDIIERRFSRILDEMTWVPEPEEFIKMNACTDKMTKDLHKKAEQEEIEKLLQQFV
jgi:hypothetical protein